MVKVHTLCTEVHVLILVGINTLLKYKHSFNFFFEVIIEKYNF